MAEPMVVSLRAADNFTKWSQEAAAKREAQYKAAYQNEKRAAGVS